jgi:four helix bundle protein
MIRSYRDLIVWQKGMDLVLECYGATRSFPKSEAFGLASQVQRAAVSVPANIAEGHGRSATGDYLRHLSIAHGSLMELETHIQIAHRLRYITTANVESLLSRTAEVGRMLKALITSLRLARDSNQQVKETPADYEASLAELLTESRILTPDSQILNPES